MSTTTQMLKLAKELLTEQREENVRLKQELEQAQASNVLLTKARAARLASEPLSVVPKWRVFEVPGAASTVVEETTPRQSRPMYSAAYVGKLKQELKDIREAVSEQWVRNGPCGGGDTEDPLCGDSDCRYCRLIRLCDEAPPE